MLSLHRFLSIFKHERKCCPSTGLSTSSMKENAVPIPVYPYSSKKENVVPPTVYK
jgi:hypothetical protein